jgi:hypothetical protein
MDSVVKIKEWINENVPMLSKAYENKYVGMLYDRFASLPARRQRQWIAGIVGTIAIVLMGYLFFAYWSLWSTSVRVKEADRMANMLIQYQKQRRDKSSSIRSLSRNNSLSASGRLKQALTDVGRLSTISPRMITVDEKSDEGGDAKNVSDIQTKRATVTLTRVTLLQTTKYLKAVENGQYDLGITSLRITNDDKIRGYMKVELGIVAYLFQGDEG